MNCISIMTTYPIADGDMTGKRQDNSDKEKYVRELRERVAAQRAENERQKEIFKSSDDPEELKQALTVMSAIDDDLLEKALAIAADTQQELELRSLALRKSVGALSDHDKTQKMALRILNDTTEDATFRITALNTLLVEEFRSPEFSGNKAEFISSLRTILDDADAELRVRAAEQLALDKDEYVQRKLLGEIKSKKAFVVNRAKAIQLLAYDLHAEHYPLLRDIVNEEEATETEKNEAILALANDTNSKELLETMATDKAVPLKLRMSGANALRCQDPYAFEKAAKKIVVDENEDNEMRILCLNNLLRQPNTKILQEDSTFQEQLRRLKGMRKSPKLKKLSREYLKKTQQNQKDDKKGN